MASDAELEVSHEDLKEALETKVGGKARTEGEQMADEEEDRMASHHLNSSTGIGLAQGVWGTGEGGTTIPSFVPIDSFDEVLKAARQSQRREQSWNGLMQDATQRDAQVVELKGASSEDVRQRLKQVRKETNSEGK